MSIDDDTNDEKFGKLPEVREYFTTIRDAHRTYQSRRKQYGRFDYTAHDRAALEYNETRDKAWQKLRTSSDPLVSWIAKHERIGQLHRDYAERILKVIPSPLATYDDVARSASWCEVWDGYKNEAILAGIIDVEYNFEYRYNAHNWETLTYWEDIPRKLRNSIDKELLTKIFMNGNSEVRFSCEGSFYTFRVKTES